MRSVARTCHLVAALLAIAGSVPVRADSILARPLATFVIAGENGMHMPTAVAVATDGTIFVADGANRRLVTFESNGRHTGEIRSVGDVTLSCPVSLCLDADGDLWIADSGLHAVIVRSSNGGLRRRVAMAPPDVLRKDTPDGHANGADVTGVAVRPDGAVAWIVDNDNHRLARFDVASGAIGYIGTAGENLGQFNYPFMAAVTADGDVLVTDVLNGRVHVVSDGGRPVRAIGTYGVDIGNLYRPKGLAIDAGGNVYVSDGTLGVVQAFRENGIVIDVLRDAGGGPLRLDVPSGLAFDREGCLYVAELGASRIRKFELTRTPTRPADRPRGARAAPSHPRACTACHVEWVEPIASGRPTPLMEVPENPPDYPLVSRSEMCLSCHDASVVDSRERVWFEHGHRTGVSPPSDMRVSNELPLVDGKLACRTCHSAHAGAAPEGDLKEAVFLRVSSVAGELCVQCHADMTRGPGFGTHPTGGMPFPIPQGLIDAGARVGPNPRELTCQTCHTPHGAEQDHLLVMGASNNELCLECHNQMRPGMFLPGGAAEHPLDAKLNDAQAAFVRAMGSQLGPNGEMVCLSCHKLHEGHGRRFMLATELKDGLMCLGCHQERRNVLDTPHDLRARFPNERNRVGMTVSEGGPCSACHLFHRYARAMTPTKLDLSGQCVTCHQQGECAERITLAGVNHPGATCTECHDPHDRQHGSFLRARGEALCAQCHSEQSAVRDGPHDMTVAPRAGASSDRVAGSMLLARDRCLVCHRPHGNEETGLWRHLPSPRGEGPDAVCAGCHAGVSWNSAGSLAIQHPQHRAGTRLADTLPLVQDTENGASRIGCRTCHDPHAASGGNPALLRNVAAGNDGAGFGASAPAELCTACHTDMRGIAFTSHGSKSLVEAGLDAVACGPCHAMHGRSADVLFAGLGERNSDAACLVCHRAAGPAKLPAVIRHPDVPLFDAWHSQSGSPLPLFGATGEHSATGQLQCRSCHLPHGRPDAVRLAAGLQPDVRKAARLQLRPFEVPNSCTSCHSADALQRFLYFHSPAKRLETAGR